MSDIKYNFLGDSSEGSSEGSDNIFIDLFNNNMLMKSSGIRPIRDRNIEITKVSHIIPEMDNFVGDNIGTDLDVSPVSVSDNVSTDDSVSSIKIEKFTEKEEKPFSGEVGTLVEPGSFREKTAKDADKSSGKKDESEGPGKGSKDSKKKLKWWQVDNREDSSDTSGDGDGGE